MMKIHATIRLTPCLVSMATLEVVQDQQIIVTIRLAPTLQSTAEVGFLFLGSLFKLCTFHVICLIMYFWLQIPLIVRVAQPVFLVMTSWVSANHSRLCHVAPPSHTTTYHRRPSRSVEVLLGVSLARVHLEVTW